MATTLNGKDVIGFYGSTGQGKTTIINYLMGYRISLREINNNNKVYDISEELTEEILNSPTGPSKIGHRYVSETLFSKGCSINNDFLEIDDYILGENSGFDDNRG